MQRTQRLGVAAAMLTLVGVIASEDPGRAASAPADAACPSPAARTAGAAPAATDEEMLSPVAPEARPTPRLSGTFPATPEARMTVAGANFGPSKPAACPSPSAAAAGKAHKTRSNIQNN